MEQFLQERLGNTYFISVPFILITIIASYYIFCKSAAVRYYTKMTAFYFTILLCSSICCILCIPAYFFGDPALVIFWLFDYMSRWTNISISTRNTEVFKTNGPFVIISNHQSSLDVLVLSQIWPARCSVMMKKSLLYVPFFNFAAILANTLFVDRYHHDKAMEQLEYCARKIKEKRCSVWVFPEGTRNHEGGMLPFKKGAFNIAVKAGVPIVPVVFSSYRPFYNKDSNYFASDGYIIAEVMEPVSTTNLSLSDVSRIVDEVHTRMTEVFDRISEEAAMKIEQSRKASKIE